MDPKFKCKYKSSTEPIVTMRPFWFFSLCLPRTHSEKTNNGICGQRYINHLWSNLTYNSETLIVNVYRAYLELKINTLNNSFGINIHIYHILYKYVRYNMYSHYFVVGYDTPKTLLLVFSRV